MPEIAILTPDPSAAGDHRTWQGALARLQRALSVEGIDTTPTPWTAHLDGADGLRGYAHVLPLLAWGYHHDHARWLQACGTWDAAGIAMANPARVLAWNSDKRYLGELADRGVPLPYTRWTDALTRAELERDFEQTGADELIVKPSVSGGAWKTWRLRRDDPATDAALEGAAGTTMLVQPYLPAIASAGETSLLYFGGRLSHVVNKRPVPGDFRVQEEHGGLYTVLPEPPAGALALAERTLAAIDAPLLYARIDTVPDDDGRWWLMEAELIEPDLYFHVDPQAGAGFARALRALL